MKDIKTHISLLVIGFCVYASIANAQGTLIGKPAPNFSLLVKNGITGQTTVRTPESYRGKWLVLDFWSKTCMLCIASFPKMDSLRQQYSKQISFLAVGINDKKYNDGIAEMYQKIAVSVGLKLDVAFDSTLMASYQVRSFPNVVIIDPKGIIRAVTYSSELTHDNLDAMINNGLYLFTQQHILLKMKECRFSDTLGDNPHHSELSSWTADDGVKIRTNFNTLKNGQFKVSAIPLSTLYLMAYFSTADWGVNDSLHSKVSRYPILKMADKSPFTPNIQKETGLYRYQLELLDSNKGNASAMGALRRDLERCFGYSATIEEVLTPVWELVVNNEQLVHSLKTKEKVKRVTGDQGGLNFYSVAISSVLERIHYYHPKNIFVDRTGIKIPIDISLDVPLISFEEIRAKLYDQGLELKKTVLPIKTLVISD